MTPDERRTLATLLDEGQIHQLVVSFYERVQQDPLLAPVFDAKIRPEEWPAHFDRMTNFWSTVLLGSGRYHGNPMAKHAALADLGGQHFDRWLELFGETAQGLFAPLAAQSILSMAQGMRAGLQHAVESYRGNLSVLH